ncbi:hypothetical protein BGZ63DRAFT_203531 [Mariannaea sp. PMI_226]|nr:hypothetical protein BGZ63DRAFT_203531 [Mariannaea sp. PMI_226]
MNQIHQYPKNMLDCKASKEAAMIDFSNSWIGTGSTHENLSTSNVPLSDYGCLSHMPQYSNLADWYGFDPLMPSIDWLSQPTLSAVKVPYYSPNGASSQSPIEMNSCIDSERDSELKCNETIAYSGTDTSRATSQRLATVPLSNPKTTSECAKPPSVEAIDSDVAMARKLRTASRQPKNKRRQRGEKLSPRDIQGRESHTKVERRYRERLNNHFRRLLEALPGGLQAKYTRNLSNQGCGNMRTLEGDEGVRVSKVEVLDMARQYICSLEKRLGMLPDQQGSISGKGRMMGSGWL